MPRKKRRYSSYTEQHQRLLASRQLYDDSSSESEDSQSIEVILPVADNAYETQHLTHSSVIENSNTTEESQFNENMIREDSEFSISNTDDLEEEDLVYFSDIEDSEDEINPFNQKLREFSLKYLNDNGMKDLLKLLDETGKFSDLPGTVDELLDTPEADMPTPVKISNGEYMHLGVRANLKFLNLAEVPNPLNVTISWDGVRIFKASRMQMWPIVMEVESVSSVFLIGIFLGNKKPKSNMEYFYCLTRELDQISESNDLVSVGCRNVQTKLNVTKYLADTPARTWAIGKN